MGDMGGESPAPPESPSPAPPAEGGTVPENDERNKENLNILLENRGMLNEDELIDLSKVQNSLGEMGTELDKLLKN
jgi:hypothetical protein